MSCPDDLPGLLNMPLDELTTSDLEAMRELKRLAELHDWDGVMRLLVKHSNPTKQFNRSNSNE